MADEDKGRAGVGQFGLKPGNRLDVQMVGRLVQQHQLRRFGHQLGQRRAPPFAARGGGDRPGGVELQPLARNLDLVGFGGVQTAGSIIAQRREPFHLWVLFHVTHGDAGCHHAGALIRLDQPGHHLHQRGFARSVAPHQRDAIPRLDHQRQIGKNGLAPEGERDVGELQKGCACHAPLLSGPCGAVKRRRTACGCQARTARSNRLRASGMAWISSPVKTCSVFI